LTPLPAVPAVECRAAFPSSPYEVVHRIEGRLAGGRRLSLLGVIRSSGAPGELEAALVTAEGMVLYQGRYDRGAVDTRRALPPFDSEAFADRLMADVALMFLPPDGPVDARGLDADGRPTCRWRLDGRAASEVSYKNSGGWIVRRYPSPGRMSRKVEAFSSGADRWAEKMILTAYGPAGYELTLTLIERRGAK
jgi:hypothetical protein